MSYFYKFLEDESTELAHILYELEDEIYNKPKYMLTHSRTFIELLMDKVTIYEKLTLDTHTTILSQIQKLDDSGLLTDEVKNALHKVRRLGNEAAHDTRRFRYSESLVAWEQLYIIVKWFVEVYLSFDIKVPEYVDPVVQGEQTDDITSRFEKLEELLKQSIKNDQPQDVQNDFKQEQINTSSNSNTENPSLMKETKQQEQSTQIELSSHNDEVIAVEPQEDEFTDGEKLWSRLNKLRFNQSEILPYRNIKTKILESPTKFVTLLDGLFIRLSKDRMEDLAKYYQVEKLSENYFSMDKLSYGWSLIRTQLNGTLDEYQAAQKFITISEIKFKRDLRKREARQALKNLLDIA